MQGLGLVIAGLLYLAGAFFIFGAIAPRIPVKAWWTRIFIYGRQQMLIALPIIFGLFIMLVGVGTIWNVAFLILLVVAFLMCLFDVTAYLNFMPKETQDARPHDAGTPCSILLVNVLEENEDYEGVRCAIRESDADIVFLSETNSKWTEELAEFEETYPYTYLLPLEEHNGLLFYSRQKIVNVNERYLCQDHIPSLTIDMVTPDGFEWRVYAIHPRPPRPEDAVKNLDDELMIIAKEIAANDHPAIVIGDFNEVGWSPAIRAFKDAGNLCDPRRGRGIINTYNARLPLMRWPLDQLFHTPGFRVFSLGRLTACGSDHFPMVFKMLITSADAPKARTQT